MQRFLGTCSHWGGSFLCPFFHCLRPLFVFPQRCTLLYYITFHLLNRPAVVGCFVGRNTNNFLNYMSHEWSSTVFPARRRLPVSSSKLPLKQTERKVLLPVGTFKSNSLWRTIRRGDKSEECVLCRKCKKNTQNEDFVTQKLKCISTIADQTNDVSKSNIYFESRITKRPSVIRYAW